MITARFVTLAERIARALGAPRVRALHLPPAAAAKTAEFCALELEDGSIGFSYVLLDRAEARLRERGAAALAGADALALARGYAGSDPAARALGFAAINALSQSLFRHAGWTPGSSGDSLGDVAPQPGEHIGMIGFFPPLVPRVVQAGARLTVLELREDLVGEHGEFRVTLDPRDLASCTRVISTCTVLLNDTLDAVLAACRHARHIAIVGPTAGCVPDPLFERGVASLGGRRVLDTPAFRDAFCAGEKWGAYAAKTTIARADYPGLDALLERLG